LLIDNQEALDKVKISKEDQKKMFSMLSAILWLGNIKFSIIDSENHVEVVSNEGRFPFVLVVCL
jgi:myosin V